jgi:hypothetical protein
MARDTDEPADHIVWLICPYMFGREDKPCQRCPRWEEHPKRGQVVRGCRLVAEEAVNIVQTGNPWRKPAAEMIGTKWEWQGMGGDKAVMVNPTTPPDIGAIDEPGTEL